MVENIRQCPVCGEMTYFNSICYSCGYDDSMERKMSYTITLGAHNNGNVTGFTSGDKYYYSYILTLTAVPDEGYEFSKWTIDGVDYTDNPLKYQVVKAVTVIAVFEEE